VRANEPGGGSTGADVQVTDQGPQVILDNGIVKATIEQSRRARHLLPVPRPGDVQYHILQHGRRRRLLHAQRLPVHCESQAPRTSWISASTPFGITTAIKPWTSTPITCSSGAPAAFTVTPSSIIPPTYPATGFGEWRMVWKLSNDLLEKIYVDDLRHWQMPSSERLHPRAAHRDQGNHSNSPPASAPASTIANMISAPATTISAAGATPATKTRSADGWSSADTISSTTAPPSRT
jgi:hypothetical protein